MSKRDYYDVLGVERDADDDALKKAYRRLAMKFHPDRNPDDAEAEERFKECKEAYEVLSDSRKRSAYDQFGHAGVSASATGGGGFGGGAGFRDIFDEVFGDIFGARTGSGGARAYRGADLRYDLELTLEDAVFGTTVKIEVPSRTRCNECAGSGAKAGTRRSTCATCGGGGQVRIQQGFFTIQQACPRCRGSGSTITDPCAACHGEGSVRQQKTLSVKVPPGVDSGNRIRLEGEGELGERGGALGDLYVEITVKPHAIFMREGNNLFCEVPTSFVTATLGGELEVPTLDGRVSLKIPPETQTGKLFRLRSKGVKSVRGDGVGDLICKVVIETPVSLGKRQKEMLRVFEASLLGGGTRHNPRASSWFDSVKRFFEDFKT